MQIASWLFHMFACRGVTVAPYVAEAKAQRFGGLSGGFYGMGQNVFVVPVERSEHSGQLFCVLGGLWVVFVNGPVFDEGWFYVDWFVIFIWVYSGSGCVAESTTGFCCFL